MDPPDPTDTERVVQEVLAQLGHDSHKHRGGRCRKPNLAQNEYRVRTGGRSSLLLAHHLETVDGDTLLLWKDGLTVETNPRSVTNARGSGILPNNVLLMGTTG